MALAVGVITLIVGSDAKVVQADASDEEVVEATQELLSDFEEYAGNAQILFFTCKKTEGGNVIEL